MSAAHAVVPRRLATWAIAWATIAVAVPTVVTALRGAWYLLVQSPSFPPPSNAIVEVLWFVPQRLIGPRGLPTVIPVLAALAWPLAAFGAIQLFGITLGRAGVRTAHVWRCVLYAWPSALLVALVAAVATLGFDWTIRGSIAASPYYYAFGLTTTGALTLATTVVLTTLQTIAAHVAYLRLPHAVAQALLVQLVAWLALATPAIVPTQMLP